MIKLSVIVPTRNRRDVLISRSLPAMFRQNMSVDDFEILVVVDGSADGTAQALRALRPPCSLRVIEQPGRGASAARNRGVQAARGHLLLFIDDDILCGPDLFRQHVEAHIGLGPSVVYGPISIAPDAPPSILKYATQTWYEEYYARLSARNGLRIPEDNFLISNSSMPREMAIACGAFDENLAAKEDYELGIRLWKRAVPFRFLPRAGAYEFFQKPILHVMWNDGKAFGEAEIQLSRKHPEYRPWSRFAAFGKTAGWKRISRSIVAGFPVNPAGMFNLPLGICDKFSRFPVMRRAGRYLLGIGRGIVEIRAAVRQAGSHRALEGEFGVRLPSILYHHVGPFRPGAHRDLTVSPEQFEQQIRWLARRGYVGITPSDWLQWIRDGRGLPPKPVLLTFDDAYADTAEYALPVLRKYGFSAAVYVVTGRLGGTNDWDEARGRGTLHLMTAEQIRYWAGQGIEFGAHTRTHARLTQLSADELSSEVVGSKNDLTALLGRPPVSFAYPYGDHDDAAYTLVRNEFGLAFTVLEGLNYLTSDPQLLRRSYIGPNDSLIEFGLSVHWGEIRSLRDWRIKLALRTRLTRIFGVASPHP